MQSGCGLEDLVSFQLQDYAINHQMKSGSQEYDVQASFRPRPKLRITMIAKMNVPNSRTMAITAARMISQSFSMTD